MKRFAVLALIMGFAFTVWSDFADAKRMGGSRSFGMQRSMPAQKAAPSQQTAPQQASPQPAAAQQPAKPAAQPTPQAPAQPAPQARGGSSWLGPIAGLAAGLGLAALASHFGFGEALANGLMIALLVVLGIVVFGWIIRRVLPNPGLATAGGPYRSRTERSRMDTARDTWQPVSAPEPDYRSAPTVAETPLAPRAGAAPDLAFGEHLGGSATDEVGAETPVLTLPDGFDAEAFVRQAKVNFIRLQAANDEGNLDDLREFTTPEVYAELKLDIDARKGAAQKTEVIDLEAAIVDYAEEPNRWVVSVRYTGRLYEDAGVVASDVDEVWHLVKPRKGSSGWVVAGIQQVS